MAWVTPRQEHRIEEWRQRTDPPLMTMFAFSISSGRIPFERK